MAWLLTCFLALEFISTPALAETKKEVAFSRGTLKIAGKILDVEIAKTDEQHERGLMFRKSMPENEGMIFIFPSEEILHFWMKNTFIDLDIGYFDRRRKLVDIHTMKAVESVVVQRPPTYPSKVPAMYALEVRAGWFKKNGVKLGAEFTLDDGPARKVPRSKSRR